MNSIFACATLLLLPTAIFSADATPAAPATALAAKAQSLKEDAQTRLDAITDSKTSATETSHIQALQAQKTAADIAVKAHETAAEWTNHADILAQSAQKLDPAATSTSSATSTTSTPVISKTSTSSAKKGW